MKFALMLMTAGLWAQNTPSLTDSQKQAIQQKIRALESDNKVQAEKLSVKVAAIAKDLDRNLLSATPDEKVSQKLSADFAAAVDDMVNAAVEAKLTMVGEIVKLLTPEQKAVLLADLEKPGANPDLAELVGTVFGTSK